MILIRKANDRGLSKTDWLTSFHTFSFSDYYDPAFVGFESLLVINEDTVKPGHGFGTHPHDNMEIISYVIEGALEHKDSMGTGSIINPGEIQIMSAGNGVRHSEFNHSQTESLHFLQIWIIPSKSGLKPSYSQKKINKEENTLILIGAQVAADGVIQIHQKVNLYTAYLTQGNVISHDFNHARNGWLQMVKGSIEINGEKLSAGDGAGITRESIVHIQSTASAEFLLFDF